jgi:hypothetical protein
LFLSNHDPQCNLGEDTALVLVGVLLVVAPYCSTRRDRAAMGRSTRRDLAGSLAEAQDAANNAADR